MWRIALCAALLAVTGVGCASRCCDTTLYQRSGKQKGIVAILPTINQVAEGDLPWDLSEEFTEEVRKKVFGSSRVYLLREHGSVELARRLNVPSPAAISYQDAKLLGAAEFVVVTELVEQREALCGPQDPDSSLLELAMRVRIIDVRHEKPKVILQEVIREERKIAHASRTDSDYTLAPWGSDAFPRTELGMAHARVVREVVSRIESYIDAAR